MRDLKYIISNIILVVIKHVFVSFYKCHFKIENRPPEKLRKFLLISIFHISFLS